MITDNGYESLKQSVIKDCERDGDCQTFNPNGCDKEHCTCFHRYCDKFKWVIDRADQYAKKLGLDRDEVLTGWERYRKYWYMNYYQDYNYPDLEKEDIRVFDTMKDSAVSFEKKGFICPHCGKISETPIECSLCGWSINGFVPSFDCSYLFVKETMQVYHIFQPVAWDPPHTEVDS